MFADRYRNRRVLITGHTGFKGSWLSLWLKNLGADVTGLALAPDTNPNNWHLLKLGVPERHVDIRDAVALSKAIKEIKPEIVFHLAAQSLVRRSYRAPIDTWATNVMGSVNVLEACRDMPDLRAMVVVSSDKCYENKKASKAYRESDRLGGRDPYSASKAATELVVASYRDAFFNQAGAPLIVTARAGNVIGGGDWAEDRLIPDLVRATQKGEELIIRSPDATRPWQHVLEPLAGYLQLGQGLLEGKKEYADAWNFGPDKKNILSVSDLLKKLSKNWPNLSWRDIPNKNFQEMKTLKLDSSKAHKYLKWNPVLTMDQQLKMTVDWYRAFLERGVILSVEQLRAYQNEAKTSKAIWAS